MCLSVESRGIKGEGKRVASLQWRDKAGKLIKSTNSPVWSDRDDVCTKDGKGQGKCVLINSPGGGKIQRNGKKWTFSCPSECFMLRYIQRPEITKNGHLISAGRLRVVDEC